jgi:hypothetical protein
MQAKLEFGSNSTREFFLDRVVSTVQASAMEIIVEVKGFGWNGSTMEHYAAKFPNIGCSLHSGKLNQITVISIS